MNDLFYKASNKVQLDNQNDTLMTAATGSGQATT